VVEGAIRSPDVFAYFDVDGPRLSALSYDHLRLDIGLQGEKGLDITATFNSKDGRGGSVQGNLPFSWQPLGIPRDREISLVVAVDKDDLSSVSGLIPRLTRASGPIVLKVNVGGTLETLRVDGTVSLSSGEVGFANIPSDVQDLLCELSFESRTEPEVGPVNKLTIDKLRGKFLDGTFLASGGVDRVVSFSPSQALKNDYNLRFSVDDLDLSRLNSLLASPSLQKPGAVSFELPPLKAEAEVTVGKGESGRTEIAVKKMSAISPGGSLLSCRRGKIVLTQTDPRKMLSNLLDLTIEMRNFDLRVTPYFHGEINTEGPDHLTLKNSPGEPVRMKGKLEITEGVVTMAARKEPAGPKEPRLGSAAEPFWDVTIVPGKEFYILLPRFRQPMDGEIRITGGLFSPFLQGRLWARPGGRLVSLSEQWRTDRCDVDFWSSVFRAEGGWSAQYNGTIDFKALGQVNYHAQKYDVAMMLTGDLMPPPVPYFEATPYLTQEEVFAALGRGEMVQRIMSGENASTLLSQEIFNIGEAEAARAILDPVGSTLKQALGLEALSIEYGFDSPIRVQLTKDITKGTTLSYTTYVTAGTQTYEAEGTYRLPERFSRGLRPKTVGVTYDSTRTVGADLRWEWHF
jgi:hypothetical protein